MPECVVCGLEDFEERDGLFFCTTCQTQTQDLIVEEEEFEEQGDTGKPLVDKRLQIRKKKDKVAKPTEYKGRPWTIYEAYQIILKQQVQALIRLGAHPKLEEFVFRLWAVYLSKLQVAFTDDEHLYPEVLKKHVRHREKYYGDLENPITVGVRNVRKNKRKNKVVDVICPADLEGEEFYEGDDPTQIEEMEDMYSSSEEEEDEDLDLIYKDKDDVEEEDENGGLHDQARNKLPKATINREMSSRLEWLSLPKLLSLCHIGLLYTNTITTAAEIVRWVEEGEIPYTEVSTLLPDEFQFGSYDPHLFSAQIPKPHALRQLTGNLAYFLNITRLPPVSVSKLVSRYILMLDLPAEFHGLVMSVLSQHPPQCEFVIKSRGTAASLPFYDALAMAYIIITLKLWFGLDDSTEKQLSEYTSDVMKLIEGKHELFVFEDWKAHITRKLANYEKKSLFSAGDVTEVQNIDSLLDSYYKSNHHQRRTPVYYKRKSSKKGEDYNRYQQSNKEDLAHPFRLAGEKVKKGSDSTPSQSLEDEAQSRAESERRKFINCSMKHITHPDTFLNDLDRYGLSDDTVYSSYVESDDDTDDDRTTSVYDAMDTMSIDTFHERPALKSSRPKSAAKEAVRMIYSKIQSNKTQQPEDFQIKMAELQKRCVVASKNFLVYKKILMKDRNSSLENYRHRSYSWIVTLCSRIVRCAPYEMDLFVLQLSNICFSFSTQKVCLLGPDIRRFKDKYFAHEDSDEDESP